MAESSPSPCLFRSFSVPSDTSCAPHEGNPLRALGESISFGRYMSESLNWEKWSVFTQNRYVEEAEKYSKPGSVAAKKAYFEAHYKRKAAEKAAALVEEANRSFERKCVDAPAQIWSEADGVEMANEEISKDIVDYQVVDCDDDTKRCKWDDGETDLEIKSEADSTEITNIEVDKETIVYHVVDCDDTNQSKWNGEENDLEIKLEANSIEITDVEINEDTVDYQDVVCDDLDVPKVEVAEKVLYPCNDMNLNVKSCMLYDNSNQLGHVEVHKNTVISIEKKAPDPGITVQEGLALPVKGRQNKFFSKIIGQSYG
ncbi:protein WVD2-like 7 [Vicia villosa]|uniref:protein WVD2-like 7 n=1 Tax=Vicia villosa TaxID=3911 RepID=UPI00273C2012|nr:protein WVD2-like 7 [Vicia villosa]